MSSASASTSISPPASYLPSWHNQPEASTSTRPYHTHLQVPQQRQYPLSLSTSTTRPSKRFRDGHGSVTPPTSPRRASKRVREPTPVREPDDQGTDGSDDVDGDGGVEVEGSINTATTTLVGTSGHHLSGFGFGGSYMDDPEGVGQNASAAAPMYTTTVAGPSSYALQEGENLVAETSEGGEGEDSALFSEQTRIVVETPGLDQMGEGQEGMDILDFGADTEPSTEPTEMIDGANAEQEEQGEGGYDRTIREGDFVIEQPGLENQHGYEDEDDDEEGGEEYFVEQEDRLEPQDTDPDALAEDQEESTLIDPSIHAHSHAVDLRKAMPPPTDTRPNSTSHRSNSSVSGPSGAAQGQTQDRMTQVIEGTVELEEEWDEDQPSPSSYHSGDSDDYEMAHRPVLDRTAIKRDIRAFIDSSLVLSTGVNGVRPYKIVDRLGEGTFSSVYLAHDQLHNEYNNESWIGQSASNQAGPSSVKVALKKILVTSSPARIENELAILEGLRGCRNVSQLITAFREEDQVIIVLPFHRSDDFRHFYRHMDPPHMRSYLRCLFRALKDIHKRGIVHRDVKPANFLYDYETEEGVLVDFGLAERYCPPRKPTCQHAPATIASLQGSKTKTSETPAVEQAVYDARKRARAGEGRVGFPHEDKRPAIKTNRAGTRGFRAPEVLLKCPDQTVAIDTWSAGVMLLSMLTHKFPVFNSSDDIEALMEIAAIFGRAAMERCALLHNRTIMTNVPTVDAPPPSLSSLVLKLNPHIYTPHMTSHTPQDAREHIESIDKAIDLCARLLRLDATKRLSAAQALRHPFLTFDEEDGDDEDQSQGEIVYPTEGKCGMLHEVEEGKHRAYFHPDLKDMQFGQGLPPSREELCPEHEHYQDRFLVNPLSTREYTMRAVQDAQEDEEDERYYAQAAREEQEREREEDEGFVVEPPLQAAGRAGRQEQLELLKADRDSRNVASAASAAHALRERSVNLHGGVHNMAEMGGEGKRGVYPSNNIGRREREREMA